MFALAAAAPAGAVELGEVIMRSHLGQPLSADVELTGLAADNAPVQVGLADAEVYRGANIAVHPALSAASITTFRRDGRRYLHIGSMVVTKSDHVPIFFTLTENGQTFVRQVTLWLTPDPNPAPPPAPEPVAAPAPALVPPLPKAAPAPVAVAAPVKFIPPPSSVAHAVTLPQASKSAACASSKRVTVDDAACVALDAKNVALNAHLVELEDKVKQLSAALRTAPPAASAAAPIPAAAAPRPAPPLPAKLVPMGSKPEPSKGAGTPWLVIGIVSVIILSLAGGLTAVLLRQRKKGMLKRKATELIAEAAQAAEPKPSFIASVKNRLMPGRSAPSAVANKREVSHLPQEAAPTVPAL
jgi:hypothetical protein